MSPERPEDAAPAPTDAIQVDATAGFRARVRRDRRPSEEPPPISLPRSTEYFGRELHERGGAPVWGALFLLGGVAIVGLCLYHNQAAVAGGVAPPFFVLGAALLYGRLFPVRYAITEEGVSVSRPRRLLGYEDIQEVFVPDPIPAGQFPIHLLLAHDVVRISGRVSASSESLYDFLRTQPLGKRSESPVPARFDNFLKQQLLVAPEHVYVFRGSKKRISARTRRYRRAAWWFLLLVVCWLGLALVVPRTPAYGPLAALAGLFGVIFLVGGYTPLRHAHARINNWDETVLIITPHALALQQGALCGELRWEELVGMSGRRGREISSLTLKVRGAAIQLFDIYHWPLEVVAQLISEFSGK
jgi:hypothetical protein